MYLPGFSLNLRFLRVITNAYFIKAKRSSARNFSKSPKKPSPPFSRLSIHQNQPDGVLELFYLFTMNTVSSALFTRLMRLIGGHYNAPCAIHKVKSFIAGSSLTMSHSTSGPRDPAKPFCCRCQVVYRQS